MHTSQLLVNRMTAVLATTRGYVLQAAELNWKQPVVVGTNPLALTLWHIPRTFDWLINTSILGAPEVADDAAFRALPSVAEFGFGTGLSPDQVTQACALIEARSLVTYVDAVSDRVLPWVGQRTDEELDAPVTQFAENQRLRPAYCTAAALAEVESLGGQPLGILLGRPTLGHVFMHLGEVDVLLQLASGFAGADD